MFTAGKVVLSFFAKRKKQGLKVVFFSVVSLVGRLRVKVSSTANVQSAAAAAAGESFSFFKVFSLSFHLNHVPLKVKKRQRRAFYFIII